jgi:hypothetical protein
VKFGGTRTAVMGNALAHFIVKRFGGCDEPFLCPRML